jgi:choline kinase
MGEASAVKEKEGWINFKNEIVRLAHTLRLKGWRRIPLDCGADIEVERLSGALTNAVYVVSPPKNLPGETPSDIQGSTVSLVPKASAVSHSRIGIDHIPILTPDRKLLLRIYGPRLNT